MRNILHIRGEERMGTNLARIAEVVKNRPKEKLQTLVHHINADTLKEKHREMAGDKAVGVDGMTKAEYHENLDPNIEELMDRMKRQAYKPQAVRRTHIPKPGSTKMRPLGIPSYEDKLVQGVMADILNTIYEPVFLAQFIYLRPSVA